MSIFGCFSELPYFALFILLVVAWNEGSRSLVRPPGVMRKVIKEPGTPILCHLQLIGS